MAKSLFIFMGRPGSGKGVQSEFLSKHTGFPIFSTGAGVRAVSKQNTLLGKKIAEVNNSGGLTPFWFASFLFEQALFGLQDDQSLIFEGVGRKLEEAKLFSEINGWIGRDFRIIYLDVPEAVVTERLQKRRELQARADDAGNVLQNRFEHYNIETVPALEYFRTLGKVVDINGEPDQETVFKEVLEKLAPFL